MLCHRANLIIDFAAATWYLVFVSFPHYNTKGTKKSMTVKELKTIISNLPDETILLVEQEDVLDVETITVQHHPDGRAHIIFSSLE